MLSRSHLLPLLVGSLTLFWSLSQAWSQTSPPEETLSQIDTVFGPVNEALRAGDLQRAETLLREMKAKGLAPNQFTRWELLASRTAVRQGNTTWLREINEGAALGETANELIILGAMRFMLAADLKQARSLLESVKAPDRLAEIPKRRYLELWMRLEQLSGNPAAERQWAERLVDFAAGWDAPTCRSCHDNPKTHPGEVSTLDLKGWWVGERYSQLLESSGDAEVEVQNAKTVLARTPNAATARLRLAYALRAQHQEADSETQLRSFPWAQFPDRPIKKPLRFAQFP